MKTKPDDIEEKRKRHQEWTKELEKARERGMQQGLEIVTNGEYIEIKKLRSMTLDELMNFIGFDY